MRNIFVIGVSGGFGTGKTTVANIFKKLGAKVIDADKIAHQLLRLRSPVYKKTVFKLGKAILNKDTSINRNRLAEIVFNDREKLSAYLKIIHPEIIKLIKHKLKHPQETGKIKVIILDAPLLIEAGLKKLVDKLVVVATKRDIQLLRIKNKFGLSKSDILKRIKLQLPLSKKIKAADYVIDNNGTEKRTEKQVRQIWGEVKRWTLST